MPKRTRTTPSSGPGRRVRRPRRPRAAGVEVGAAPGPTPAIAPADRPPLLAELSELRIELHRMGRLLLVASECDGRVPPAPIAALTRHVARIADAVAAVEDRLLGIGAA